MIKVLIVDDDIYIRESLKIILDIQEGIEVIGTCEDGKRCIEVISQHEVDVILLDLRMPVMNGLDLLKYFSTHGEDYSMVKVLVLTTFDEEQLIHEAIHLGAVGYLLKNSTPDKITSAIKAVALGNQVFESKVIHTLGEQHKVSAKVQDDIERDTYMIRHYALSQREVEIVQLIAKGLSNKEIAQAIYISEGTVKNYITNILSKMELKHRTQIAITYLTI